VAKRELDDIAKWAAVTRNLAIYEYYIQGNLPDLPRLIPGTIRSSVRAVHKLGSRYFQTQSGDGYALNGLNYYVLGKLLWNPGSCPKSVIAP
jgi:hypothetical protein